jgi:hypothetical protein
LDKSVYCDRQTLQHGSLSSMSCVLLWGKRGNGYEIMFGGFVLVGHWQFSFGAAIRSIKPARQVWKPFSRQRQQFSGRQPERAKQ